MTAATLAAVLGTLADRVVVEEAGREERPVRDLQFWDAASQLPVPPDALLMAVNVAGLSTAFGPMSRIAPTAILLGADCRVGEPERVAARDAGIALLRLRSDVDWLSVPDAVGHLVRASVPTAGTEAFADVPDGDLFALAEALCRLIDAPVTVEDRNANVLAFSTRQEEADPIRIASILRRRTPKDYYLTATDDELGAERPLFIPGRQMPDGTAALPRAVVAIPDDGRVLGTIWAVVRGPLGEQQAVHLAMAARVASRHLRHLGHSRRQARSNLLVRNALDGNAEAAAQLGIAWPAAVVKVAIGPDAAGPLRGLAEYVAAAAWRERIGAALTVHLEGLGRPCWMTTRTDNLYEIVALGGLDDNALRTACEHFLDIVAPGERWAIGIGRIAADAVALRRSREDADAATRVLRHRRHGGRVGRIGDLVVPALLAELRDSATADGRGPSGPLAKLCAYDAARASALVPTLRGWLESLGTVSSAAARCGVHPNTFRYRLSRIAEVSEVDLADPETRFALALQLAIYDDAGSGGIRA